ncbi:FHA domain-containing protein [Streptomyces sp. TS71-3]|uniref:FHA domain-containing protein n=1 Tax=Streptomyces sp. TS71-3 TaxID=2733862 RepID=UPI001B14C736|nr:FHA domain-containing protein [Streptomyces sp. TS71-3]GHJ36459.1 hypothetical protein Sm713_20680 [Streptomyces sp. TS71-3]
MQIRLTVLGPLRDSPAGAPAASDVLVTAPAGTALGAVASSLAAAVGADRSEDPVVLYAGEERLDPRRCTLGEPPLLDGTVLAVGAPADGTAAGHGAAGAVAQLHVVAGPDAGGVHFLHGGQIRLGRSAEADVPLDDPDVSRLHCAVTVTPGGDVTLADLGSTNGTTIDGAPVSGHPVRFPPGALLRLGESALRLSSATAAPAPALPTAPDGEGHVRVRTDAGPLDGRPGGAPEGGGHGAAGSGAGSGSGAGARSGGSAAYGSSHGGSADGGGRAREGAAGASGGVAGVAGGGFGAGGGGGSRGDFGDGFQGDSGDGFNGGGRSAGGVLAGGAGHRYGGPGGSAGYAGGARGADGAFGGGSGGGAYGGSGGESGRGSGGGPAEGTHHGYGSAGWGAAGGPAGAGGAGRGSAYGHERGHGGEGGRGPGGTGQGRRGPAEPTGQAAGGWAGAPGAAGGSAGQWGQARSGDGAAPQGSGGSRGLVGGGGRRDDGWGADSWADTRERDAPHTAGWPGEGTGGAYEEAGAPGGPHDPGATGEGPGAPGRGPGPAYDTEAADQGAGGTRRRGGLSAWARRLAGGRTGEAYGEQGAAGAETSGSGLRHGYGTYGGLPAGAPGTAAPAGGADADAHAPAVQGADETWPDPAALLLTALGPGARLWERGPRHPDALTVRLGTADRPARGGGVLPAVPVTTGLREVGSLGLAGPRRRLSGLVRSVLAQLAGMHSPDTLEIVLISTDRRRSTEERIAEWAWLGWLPHLRPGRGQECRLLVAYDRDQAAARADELLRRLAEHEDHLAPPAADGTGPGFPEAAGSPVSAASAAGARQPGGTGGHGFGAGPGGPGPGDLTGGHGDLHGDLTGGPGGLGHGGAHPAAVRPGPAPVAHVPAARGMDDAVPAPGAQYAAHPHTASASAPQPAPEHASGPYTVVVVDGDPGTPEVREAVIRMVEAGAGAGVHVLCLAETGAVSAATPVAAAYEAACEAAPAFRSCGAVALLSGDVATELRLLRAVRGRLAGRGVVAALDAVSGPWAERFARALAPLRPEGGPGGTQARASAPLPQAARLLDELGLARATPASLLARWAAAAEDRQAAGGRATAVLGAGPRGPLAVDLVAEGPHLLVEGPAGSGRTELLRAVAASLAAAERPDRLGLVLIDGCDDLCAAGAGPGSGPLRGPRPGAGEGLRICLDLPHAVSHLAVHDPVRMREFAQSLTAELKRRAELLGRLDFAEWHSRGLAPGRVPARGARESAGARVSEEGASSARAQEAGSSGRLAQHGVAAARVLREDAAVAGGEQGPGAEGRAVEVEAPSATLHLRTGAVRPGPAPGPGVLPLPGSELPRLVVLVDDLDALLAPPLGSPGRPAAGSVVRALDAVVREGARLGVHLVAAGLPGGRMAESEPGRAATLRVALQPASGGADDPVPGRGVLRGPAGRNTAFQGGRVTGRIPRTGTLRPTVVPLEWERMGDPPARRSVRELGNGPTDLALLASALERAARADGRGGV